MILKQGSSGDDVRKLQLGLAYLGYHPGIADGRFGRSTEEALGAFQTAHKLFSDGKAGPSTLQVYNAALADSGDDGDPYFITWSFTKTPDTEIKPGPNLPKLTKPYWPVCAADTFGGGRGNTGTVLRSDIAVLYDAFYQEIHDLGGIVTSAGGRRLLDSESNPNRSKKSFHYTGRAFDLDPASGMNDPATDPYVITQAEGRYWEVWARSTLATEEMMKKLYGGNVSGGKMTHEAWHILSQKDAKGKMVSIPTTTQVRGMFFSLTDVALKHDFHRISARRSFFTSGNAGGAEWWHFQNVRGLVKGDTTFGSDLRRVYTLEDCRKFAYWDEVRNAVFGVGWV